MCWVRQNQPTNGLYKAAMWTKKINLISNTYARGKGMQIKGLFYFHPLNILYWNNEFLRKFTIFFLNLAV